MRKSAKIITELQPHQKAALERGLKNNLILAEFCSNGVHDVPVAVSPTVYRLLDIAYNKVEIVACKNFVKQHFETFPL